MSSSAIQVLSSVGASPSSNTGASISAGVGDDAPSGQPFSRLLDGFGAQADGGSQQSFSGGAIQKVATLNSVVAQEVPDINLNGLEQLLQKHDEPITPEKAEILLARVEQLLRGKADNTQQAALASIREQLQIIARGGEPKTLEAMVQAAAVSPLVKEGKLSLTAIFAMLTHKKSAVATKTEEAPTSLAANTQAMPAGMFRSVDRAAASATAALEKTKNLSLALEGEKLLQELQLAAPLELVQELKPEMEQSPEYAMQTLVTPLAATSVIAAPVDVVDMVSSASQVISDLDSVIAPLKIQGEAALPAVELPSLGDEAKLQNLSTQALAASGAVPKEGTKSNEAGVVISDKSLASFENLLNPSHSQGLSPTQTLRAPQPVQLPYGLVNHAPVTDQVKVAIQQASKDGVEQITIQLDPVDLGRVEVSMKTNREGVTQISFMVDKADTFDGLSRDARFLERALQDVGIKSDTGSMQFNLRQPPQPQLHSDLGGNRQQQHQAQDDDDGDVAVNAVSSTMNFTKNYTLNVREGVDISA